MQSSMAQTMLEYNRAARDVEGRASNHEIGGLLFIGRFTTECEDRMFIEALLSKISYA